MDGGGGADCGGFGGNIGHDFPSPSPPSASSTRLSRSLIARRMGNGARRNNPRRCNIPIDDDEDDDDDEGVRRRGERRDRATMPDGDNATAVVAAAARVEQYVFVIKGSIAPTIDDGELEAAGGAGTDSGQTLMRFSQRRFAPCRCSSTFCSYSFLHPAHFSSPDLSPQVMMLAVGWYRRLLPVVVGSNHTYLRPCP